MRAWRSSAICSITRVQFCVVPEDIPHACGKSDVSQSWKQFIEYCNWSRCAGWTNWRSNLRENNVQGGVLEQEWIAWGAAPNAQRSVKTPNALTGTHDVTAGLRAGERTTSNCCTPTGIKCAYTMLAWISLRWHYEYLNHALLLCCWWRPLILWPAACRVQHFRVITRTHCNVFSY